jgi:hypothetical protein
MDLGVAIIAIIMILGFIVPVILLNRKRKKDEN